MAPLPEDNTARAFLKYRVQGREHTMQIRVDATATDAEISEDVGALLEAMDTNVSATQFVSFERAELGSNVRVPADWSGPSTWGTGADIGDESAPNFWSFVGKDAAGRRFRLDLYGRSVAPNDDWRVFAADDATIAAAVAALETTDAVFLTINGGGAFYKQYANMSVSQHWIDEARR